MDFYGSGGVALNSIFAETLRKLREEKGLTQKQLGQLMFVNHSTVARWENCSRRPDAASPGAYVAVFRDCRAVFSRSNAVREMDRMLGIGHFVMKHRKS